MPKRTMADGRIKLFWRDDRSQALEWGGFASGEFIHVLCDDTPEAIQEGQVKFDELKRQFKAEFKTDQRRKRDLLQRENTAHLPDHSLRKLAAMMLEDTWKDYSDGRRKTLIRMVERWEAWWGEDVNVNEIKFTHYAQYKDEVCRAWNFNTLHDPENTHYEAPGENGLYQNLSALHCLLKYAAKAEVLTRSVIAGPTPVKRKRKTLTIDQSVCACICKYMLRRTVRATHPHHPKIYNALVWFEFSTAARSIEALSLTWRDVDFEKGQILFRNTKNGEDRRITMFELAREQLKNMQSLGLPRPFPVSGDSYRSAWNQAVADAMADQALLIDEDLMPELTPHILRHSCLTNYANLTGFNEHLLKTVSGHKDSRSLDQYLKQNDQTLERIKVLVDGPEKVSDRLNDLQTV